MPLVSREYDVGQTVWFVDARDNSLHTGEVISVSVHAFATLSGTVTRVLYKIYDRDDYFTVPQEHVGATAQEASSILEQLLDSYEC